MPAHQQRSSLRKQVSNISVVQLTNYKLMKITQTESRKGVTFTFRVEEYYYYVLCYISASGNRYCVCVGDAPANCQVLKIIILRLTRISSMWT